jgi:hypothetical protein
MKKSVAIFQVIWRIAGLLLVLLGLGFWTGHLLNLVAAHIALGVLFVGSLAGVATIAALQGRLLASATPMYVLAVAVLLLGGIQTRLLPGPVHWIVQLVHLALGVGAAALAERIARRIRHASTPAVAKA